MFAVVLVISAFLFTFFLTALWLRYLKYLFPSVYTFLVRSELFSEYLRCYACVSFWVSLIVLVVFTWLPEAFLSKIALASLASIAYFYHLETSKLLVVVRENLMTSVLSIVAVFLWSFQVDILAYMLIFSFLAVVFNLFFEKLLQT